MRFVETRTPERQGCLMLHRTPHLFIRQQTAGINAIRAHLAEFGIVAPSDATAFRNAHAQARRAHHFLLRTIGASVAS